MSRRWLAVLAEGLGHEPLLLVATADEQPAGQGETAQAAAVTERMLREMPDQPDAGAERAAACDGFFGGETTYCRNDLATLAMTSAIYLAQPFDPATSARR